MIIFFIFIIYSKFIILKNQMFSGHQKKNVERQITIDFTSKSIKKLDLLTKDFKQKGDFVG